MLPSDSVLGPHDPLAYAPPVPRSLSMMAMRRSGNAPSPGFFSASMSLGNCARSLSCLGAMEGELSIMNTRSSCGVVPSGSKNWFALTAGPLPELEFFPHEARASIERARARVVRFTGVGLLMTLSVPPHGRALQKIDFATGASVAGHA